MTCWDWPFPAVNSHFARRPCTHQSQPCGTAACVPDAEEGPEDGAYKDDGRGTRPDFSLECSFPVVILCCPHSTRLWVQKRWSAHLHGRKNERNGRMRCPDPFQVQYSPHPPMGGSGPSQRSHPEHGEAGRCTQRVGSRSTGKGWGRAANRPAWASAPISPRKALNISSAC